MNSVGDVLKRKESGPLSVPHNTAVIEGLKLMAEMNIGSLIVLRDGEYQGIVTERDYSRKVLLQGKTSANTTVAEIMSVDLPKLVPEDTIDHCMKLMSDKNIRYLPVFENEKLVGIISMSDVVKQKILEQKETIKQLENYIHQ
jgi:CBS domain-containing protein